MMLLAELAGKLGNDARVEMLQKVETKEALIDVLTSEEVEASENEVEDAEEFDESLISF
jgi:PTS system fructose-specific IIA component